MENSKSSWVFCGIFYGIKFYYNLIEITIKNDIILLAINNLMNHKGV